MPDDAFSILGRYQDHQGVCVEIEATPFQWKDPATLPRREWLYGRYLIRGYVSATGAPGGVGKTSLSVVESLAMASGRRLLHDPVLPEGLRVWVWNLEDPRDELDRRIIAACLHHGISREDIEGRLFVDSGRDKPLCIAEDTKDGVMIRPEVDALVDEMNRRKIDVLRIDPFVSSHRVGENDNVKLDRVVKEWARVAGRSNAAIELVHHTRKQPGDIELTADSLRGAKALVDGARAVRVLQPMSKEEARNAKVPAAHFYFRIISAKSNLAPPPDKSHWIKLHGLTLANGDDVGVAEAWSWPDPFAGVTDQTILAVQKAITGKEWRENVQADDWAGKAVAEVMGLNPEEDRGRIQQLLRHWIANGALKVKKLPHKRAGRDCPMVLVGQWATKDAA